MTGPDFIGIGAQKSGTSWVARVLASHTSISVPAKEVHFFDQYWDRGQDWYRDRFRSQPGTLVGEFTPKYMYLPECCNRIADTCPGVRLVCILRNPVDRAISSYRMMRQRLGESRSFAECLAATPDLTDRGRYFEQLQPYFSTFGEDRLLVLLFEEVAAEPSRLASQLGSFLGVDPAGFVLNQDRSPSNEPRLPRLRKLMTGTSHALRQRGLDGVANTLSRVFGPAARRVLETQSRIRVEVENGIRAGIRSELDADKCRLEQLLGRPTGWW